MSYQKVQDILSDIQENTMSERRTMDLTEGNIFQQILIFSAPIFIGNLFQNLYNSVDSLVVGNFVGKGALAAVNTCAPISNLLIGFFTGMSAGASVLFARNFGAKDYGKLKRAIHTTLTFALILGIVMALFGMVFSRQLLRIVDCPSDIFEDANRYLKIYIAGILFTSIYNVESGVMRAVGDSRSPFYALVTASFINIVLDIVLVRFIGLGVIGVAIATVISQSVSVCMVYRNMHGLDERYRFNFKDMGIEKDLLLEVIDLGLPAGIQSSLISISNLFVHRYINSFGSTATAGVGIAQRLDRFVSMPCQALGLAITTFVSQNIGAGKRERIKNGMLTAFTMGMVSIAIMGIPLMLNTKLFLGLFNRDPEVLTYGAQMVHILVPFYFLMAMNQVMSGTLRGYGFSRQVMMLSLIGMIGIRQVFLYISMHIDWNIRNVFIGFPVGWFFQSVCVYAYFFYLKRSGKLEDAFIKNSKHT